eukprot:Amastigsp_a180768_7.p2 type:complete len:225 gc:universal Amastigsp_a180768_7:767-93(-)
MLGPRVDCPRGHCHAVHRQVRNAGAEEALSAVAYSRGDRGCDCNDRARDWLGSAVGANDGDTGWLRLETQRRKDVHLQRRVRRRRHCGGAHCASSQVGVWTLALSRGCRGTGIQTWKKTREDRASCTRHGGALLRGHSAPWLFALGRRARRLWASDVRAAPRAACDCRRGCCCLRGNVRAYSELCSRASRVRQVACRVSGAPLAARRHQNADSCDASVRRPVHR